jgi:hypothetical protein
MASLSVLPLPLAGEGRGGGATTPGLHSRLVFLYVAGLASPTGLPLFEAVMNSFQAIRDAKLAKGKGHVTIAILRETDLFKGENPPIIGFEVTDNGIGLDDENFDSFNTAFSRRKVSAGGKGLGRFTWLKAFDGALIESTFQGENSLLTRSYTFDERYTLDTAGLPMPVNTGYPGTTITLTGLKRNYKEKVPRSVDVIIQKLIEHFILVLLEPDCPMVILIDQGQLRHQRNLRKGLPISVVETHVFNRRCRFHDARVPLANLAHDETQARLRRRPARRHQR